MKKSISFLSLIVILLVSSSNVFAQKSKSKLLRSWSVGVFGGSAYTHSSENLSLSKDETEWFNPVIHAEVTKYITHYWGVSAYYNRSFGGIKSYPASGSNFTETDFQSYGLNFEFNLSALGARSMLQKKWAAIGYLGLGALGYDVIADDGNGNETDLYEVDADQTSLSAFGGLGLRRKISNSFDVELRALYNFTGDEQFDGIVNPNSLESDDDNFFQVQLGVRYNIGKSDVRRGWSLPIEASGNTMDDLNDKTEDLQKQIRELKKKILVDEDKDGVPNIYDQDSETPSGSKVYGNGTAVDTDGDGVIDAEDKCPLIKGTSSMEGCAPKSDKDKDGIPDELDDCPNTAGDKESAGCPKGTFSGNDFNLSEALQALSRKLFFDTGSNNLKESSKIDLNQIYKLIKKYPQYNYVVEGHTDNVGSASSNLALSKKRADAVVDYLVGKGVNKDQLKAIGKGETEPQATNATEAGRQLNRRTIIFYLDKK